MEEKIIGIIKDQLNYKKEVTLESKLSDDLELDSLDEVEIVMYLEEEYGIEIPDEVIEDWKTVKDIVDYIKESKKNG